MFKTVYQLKELGTFKTLAEAFKVIYDKIKAEKVLLWQMLETTIWIEAPCDVISFYDARDEMCKQGYLVNGKWVDKDIPPDPQYGREPDKVKPLAQYLDEYLEAAWKGTIDCAVGVNGHELLEQALDAYQSTENVTIKIERK